ncbi:hypothetical protein, partial [Bacillus sp. FJAT-27245]|uniref:hypothetical protein n=1 Tax=Bacillus sp. FJAT-27245 TaxID=1684144 RepID=UPI001E4CBD78
DLHVLGTPPAFVLSQDQTLQKELSHAQNVTLTSNPKITILLFVDACLFSFQRAIFLTSLKSDLISITFQI